MLYVTLRMKTLILLCFCFLTISTFSQTAEDTTVYQVVEQMPEFPGGEDALLKYMSKNLKYPEGDYTCDPGKQIISFIVEKDGSISNIKAIRDTKCKMHDNMVINTIKAMPKWKPGMQNGRPARVQYKIPIIIHLR
jgi:protein TonB